jgi:GT2 family glycosyltransferase
MKVAVVTITFNRLELTEKTIESFCSKTKVDFHLFVDNGSTDGTQNWIKRYHHIPLERNYGIAYAFTAGVNALEGYDYILKLDNDIETVSDNIIERMLEFYRLNGDKFVCSPTDLLLDPNFAPRSLAKVNMNGFNVEYVTHTGGAFQLIPIDACRKLCNEFRSLSKGDLTIGGFFQKIGYKPVYLRDLEMRHIGLNQSTPGNQYIL